VSHKNATLFLEYNPGVSWAVVRLCIPVETELNLLNGLIRFTLHVTKVYFLELLLRSNKKLINRWDSERGLFTTTSYTYYEIQKRRQKQTVKQSLNSHSKVHFAYGKHTCPQLPNESLTIIDSCKNSATGSSQDMSKCCGRMEKYGIPQPYREREFTFAKKRCALKIKFWLKNIREGKRVLPEY